MPTSPQNQIIVDSFGIATNGKRVNSFTLFDGQGTKIVLINYGATLVQWWVKDKSGQLRDVVLGYDSLLDYENDQFYLGCTIGRVANRISYAKFSLGGHDYNLPVNNGANHLHGGLENALSRKVWSFKLDSFANKVTFSAESEDGEEGYPGNLSSTVSYQLTADSRLVIDYVMTTDKITIVNPTNHTYFNLNGHPQVTFKNLQSAASDIGNHEFHFSTENYLLADDHLVTGEMANTAGSRYDFSQPKCLETVEGGGFDYDNYFCFHPVTNDRNSDVMRQAASVKCPATGIGLNVETSSSGFHFYTADFLDNVRGKSDTVYGKCSAFCLETTEFPDAINKPQFPQTTVLRPGETFRATTAYSVSTAEEK